MRTEMNGVREYAEEYPVELNVVNGRHVVVALNQGGNDSTAVDLLDLLAWLRTNHPGLLESPEAIAKRN